MFLDGGDFYSGSYKYYINALFGCAVLCYAVLLGSRLVNMPVSCALYILYITGGWLIVIVYLHFLDSFLEIYLFIILFICTIG